MQRGGPTTQERATGIAVTVSLTRDTWTVRSGRSGEDEMKELGADFWRSSGGEGRTLPTLFGE